MQTVFTELIAPLKKFFKIHSAKIDEQAASKSLFFEDFTLKLILAHIMQFTSLRVFVTELKTNETVKQLGFSPTPYSTLKDGFSRFEATHFQNLFQFLLKNSSWMSIPAIDELGLFQLVDGSIFPNISSMTWAKYKKTKNAIRVHMSFELNRMIPTEFITTAANFSERIFLGSILQKGTTYIADRGYFSFQLAAKVDDFKAFFIFRIKSNLLFTVGKQLPITSLSGTMPLCFSQITDQLIRFDKDEHEKDYRLVRFIVMGNEFLICTNRLDLTTLEIIMLYAYRWQVELLFKFIKRTINGIHLFNLSKNGVTIHFYTLMITALLQLRFKQFCVNFTQFTETIEEDSILRIKKMEQLATYSGYDPSIWIKTLTSKFYKYWKIGIHWLIKLRNLIVQPLDIKTIRILGVP